MKLRELLEDYDWVWYDKGAPRPHEENTRAVRVYFGCSEITSAFFEIGRCAIFNRDNCKLGDFIRKDILNTEVNRYYVDDYLNILCIHLEEEQE